MIEYNDVVIDMTSHIEVLYKKLGHNHGYQNRYIYISLLPNDLD